MDSPDDVIYRHQSPNDNSDSDDDRHVTIHCSCRENLEAHRTQRRLLGNIQYLAEREFEREKQETVLDEWEIVAKVADRSFLVLFLVTITCTSLMIFTSAPKQSDNGI